MTVCINGWDEYINSTKSKKISYYSRLGEKKGGFRNRKKQKEKKSKPVVPAVKMDAGHWQVARRPGCPVTISRTVVFMCECVCVCAPGKEEKLRCHFGSAGADAVLGTGLVARSEQCVCV